MVGRALRCAPRASGCGRNAPVLTPSAGSSNLPKLALGDFTRPFCIPHSAFCIRSRVAFGSQEGGYRLACYIVTTSLLPRYYLVTTSSCMARGWLRGAYPFGIKTPLGGFGWLYPGV